jgi:hypothetical protein
LIVLEQNAERMAAIADGTKEAEPEIRTIPETYFAHQIELWHGASWDNHPASRKLNRSFIPVVRATSGDREPIFSID